MSQPLWLLLLLPAVGAVCALALGRARPDAAKVVALLTALLQAVVTAYLIAPVFSGSAVRVWQIGAAAAARTPLVVEGLSGSLVALTALLGIVAVLASWKVDLRPGSHFALLLLLQAAVTAVFLANELVLFYVAWEAVLIPMYFLIGVWGHEQRRHAAMKFFLFTFAGSALMLVGILLLVAVPGVLAPEGRGVVAAWQPLVFWLLMAGFAVKVPIWPLHTWLPDAHVEAPTAGSIMLAGVLLKMGGYGMLRWAYPLAPEAAAAAGPLLAALGIIGIVYGALMALAQTDLKRLVAYSSVSHMGFFVLAVSVGTQAAYTAAVLVMVAHGLTSALLFLLVGSLYDRTHTRDMSRFGGLVRTIPLWGGTFVFACLASLGLPGLAGFPGELLTVLEGFGRYGWWMGIVAVGVVLAGVYNLRAIRRVGHGAVSAEWADLPDLALHEKVAVTLLVLSIVAMGIYPTLVAVAASGWAGLLVPAGG
ncbi:MAG: NADH-quinone oxidoreductase subunit M [Coriobacteriia bacterium]|nr:NADH-quinone oxidoreductase subunit M [Coriobacteriia bacterium]